MYVPLVGRIKRQDAIPLLEPTTLELQEVCKREVAGRSAPVIESLSITSTHPQSTFLTPSLFFVYNGLPLIEY